MPAHLPFERTFGPEYQEWLTKDDLAEGYQRWVAKYDIVNQVALNLNEELALTFVT
jgi:hypothetical protein